MLFCVYLVKIQRFCIKCLTDKFYKIWRKNKKKKSKFEVNVEKIRLKIL